MVSEHQPNLLIDNDSRTTGVPPNDFVSKENKMFTRLLTASAVAIATFSGAAWFATAASAQSNMEVELAGLHQLCNQGDRRACVRFGMLMGENKQRHADWRRAHADWWWWERL
jgi:hypothetical protein